MYKEKQTIFSHELNRDMEVMIYGTQGVPCLFFPSEKGNHNELEQEGLVEYISHYIDEGRLQLICVQTIDQESWLKTRGEDRERIEQQERFFHYVVDELVPLIQHNNKKGEEGFLVAGASIGAMHAMNFFLRRADLFHKVIAMSGMYRANYYFDQYQDELVYQNSCLQYVMNQKEEDSSVSLYKNSEIILCCGKSASEYEYEQSMTALKEVLERLHVDLWADYWGYDVNHDWYWWKKQFDYFLQFMI